VNFTFADPPWLGPHGAGSKVGPVPAAAQSTFDAWCYCLWKIPKQDGFTYLNLDVSFDAKLKKRLVSPVQRKEKHMEDWFSLANTAVPIPSDPPSGN